MAEVWVPTEFHRGTFQSSGVHPSKLFVVPEAVDVEEFDPSKHNPLPLPMGTRVFGPAWPHPAGGGGGGGAGGQQQQQQQKRFVFLSIFKWESRKVRGAAAGGAALCMLGCLPAPSPAFQGIACSSSICLAMPWLFCCRGAHTAGLGRPAASLPDDFHGERKCAADVDDNALSQQRRFCRADGGKQGNRWLPPCAALLLAELAGCCAAPSASSLKSSLCCGCVQEWARQDLLQAGRRPKHLPSVYVLGQHVPQRSYPRLFKSADCFVLPTR